MRNTEYIEFDEKVDRFLRKQMTPREQEEFQKYLMDNPPLLERAQTIALTIKAMEAVQSKKEDRLLRAIQEMDEKDFRKLAHLPPLRQAPRMPKIARYAAAAAVVGMLCFGGAWYYRYDRTINLGESQYKAYVQEMDQNIPLDLRLLYDYKPKDGVVECRIVNPEIIRGGSLDESEEAVMHTLYPLFLKVRDGKDLNETIQKLNSIYTKAKKVGEVSEYSDYIDDIAWNIAIAYLKVGDRDNSIPLLEDIVRRNEDFVPRSQPAQNLIEQIRKIN